MMLDYSFKMTKEADLIKEAVEQSLIQGIVTEDLSKEKSYKTSQVGDWIRDYIKNLSF